jgi:leukotriene-A4 hydrolase
VPHNNLQRLTLVNLGVLLALHLACEPDIAGPPPPPEEYGDLHTYSHPERVKIEHLRLDLTVDFEAKVLRGDVTLDFTRIQGTDPITLDTRALKILAADYSLDGSEWQETEFRLGEADAILGTPLDVDVPISSGRLRIRYETTGGATAVQWLEPRQTAGKRHPFLFTQSQAIHARSWIPLQDTPAVKTTYSARIRTPKALRAVMSASNLPGDVLDGDFNFEMPQPVPSYLIALAVGELEFRTIGPRTGIYAEPPVVDKAAAEFEDTEDMLIAAERLFGKYQWGRYDILVLPPSFPFGGMENPRLTFATPTVLAGDKSLVSLVAHELAHSWSGNLVTNATWSDFWLNEGFTVYLERKILEAVYGPDRAGMEAVLGRRSLDEEFARLPEPDHILYVNLKGRDPDDGMTEVPYEKGALLLATLETVYGREAMINYLRGYFEMYAFTSITTREFIEDLRFHLFNNSDLPTRTFPLEDWIYKAPIPEGAWVPISSAFTTVEEKAAGWLSGQAPASSLGAADWNTQQWLHLLSTLPSDVGPAKMQQLDQAYGLTASGNSEILSRWLVLGIKNGYAPALPRIAEFLTSQGRRKFLQPLYIELARTEAGKKRAEQIYRQARPTYHPISVATIDEILGWQAD